MNPSLRFRLGLLLFLQYAIWGAWYPVLPIHLRGLGFSGLEISRIFSTMGIGAIVAVLFAGHLADRYVSIERYLAVAHALSGAALLAADRIGSFRPLFAVMLVQAILYAPTVSLAETLVFHHLRPAGGHFGTVRVWGTVGWMAAAWSFGTLLGVGDCLTLGAALSFGTAVFCLTLPHTPPAPRGDAARGASPFAFLEAFGLLRDRAFACVLAAAFLVAVSGRFYFNYAALFYEHVPTPGAPTGLGIPQDWVSPVLSFGQFAEAVMLALLPWLTSRLAFRTLMAVGILAWIARFAAFAVGTPAWAVLAAQGLHGVSLACFTVVTAIYVNRSAPEAMRARAQSLLSFLNLGVALIVGNELAGAVFDRCGGDFRWVFAIPAGIGFVALIVLRAGVRERGGAGG